ncbi:MAG: hypothetical protein EOP05_10440 [Proteobacteria bacterium]|nr:MAG: hypothetical protein EOP05_10440 [Pseudomonadota bacterium]
MDLAPDLKPPPQKRWVGIDLVRLISLFAITVHHFIWVIWYTPDLTPVRGFLGWDLVEAYARFLSFSGHSILFLSCFLIGYSEIKALKTWRVVIFVAAGWILFCSFEKGENPVFWAWDIYPLIVFGLASGALLKQLSKKAVYAIGLLGFLMTWIPFWEFSAFDSLSLQWRHWLVGDCSVDLADWPILPWAGFIWAPYALGVWVRDRLTRGLSNPLARFTKPEAAFWLIGCVVAFPNLGAFYKIILGPSFACYSFRQPPYIFWSHFIYVLFVLRLTVVDRVQNVLVKVRGLRLVSRLKVSTSFGLFYLVHYTLIEMCRAFLRVEIQSNIPFSFFVFAMILPVTEATVWILEGSVKKILNRRHRDVS